METKMDPTAKALWITALRSGEYMQTEGSLQDAEGCNCCLGVLAKINDVPYRRLSNGDGIVFDFGRQEGISYESNFAPPAEYKGLEADVIDGLITMNDVDNRTFSEIADWIEANL